MPGSANSIIAAAEKRFGPDSKPKAIILTHGHFDHVGAIIELVEHYDVPVFAHELEMPFLTGQQPYSPPDPTVEGASLPNYHFGSPMTPSTSVIGWKCFLTTTLFRLCRNGIGFTHLVIRLDTSRYSEITTAPLLPEMRFSRSNKIPFIKL